LFFHFLSPRYSFHNDNCADFADWVNPAPRLTGLIGLQLRVSVSFSVFRHNLNAPENYTQQQKHNRGHYCVTNDTDIPNLHIRQWHPHQPSQAQKTADNHEDPHG
jgi:hypothetical protein